ncbi:MAG: SusF/SusE family outer membrane protein [Candidatus Azobacteroides sp.]|nr:SusF/SusE family outer membrane protein [Candidatus Azobacteroides sp.]
MKKIYFFLATLLVAGFSACSDEVGLNVTPPQSYPQEAPQVIEGFTVAPGDDFKSDSPLVLTEEEQVFQVAKVTATPVMAEGATVMFRTEISDTPDFGNVVALPVTSADNAATTLSSDLSEAVKTLFNSKAPDEHTIYLRNYIYILDGTSASLISSMPAVFGAYNVTPYSNVIIESAYYLIGDVNGWSFDNLSDNYKFYHSDKDVYDDPVFTITVQMAANSNFKIVPQSSKDSGDWGGVLGNPENGNTDLEGVLVAGNDAGAMLVEEEGWVKITINMLESTYTIELLGNPLRQLYVPGAHQSTVWDPPTAPIVFSPDLDWKFDGYVYMKAGNEFKFTSAPNWTGINYGNGGDGGELSIDGGAGNLSVSADGFYRLTVDLSKEPYTYTATATEWGLIGDATSGGWDASTSMELNTATGEWTVTTDLAGGKAFKFRANNGWDINLGGDVNNLTYNGDNIPVASSGTYLITLKLGDPKAYTCTIVKQ